MTELDMDTSKLVVGQKVTVFGCGYFDGTVVSITPSGVGVETDNGFAQFDKDGNETEDSRYRRLGVLQDGPGPEWGPWELKPLRDPNVSIWLIQFLKHGEKPADEIFKEAEKKFGDADDAVREASYSLGLAKRQENGRWYWSMRWELDENYRVIGPAPNQR